MNRGVFRGQGRRSDREVTLSLQCSDPNGAALFVITSQALFTIQRELDGATIRDAQAAITTVSSSGNPVITLQRIRGSVTSILTVPAITIMANQTTSYTGQPRPSVDQRFADLAVGDQIRVDVTTAGTGAKGLQVFLTMDVPS